MSLIAVRRLYPDAVPPTAWTLDGTPLATKRFRFTRRTDQASSASFECSGSPALTIGDRVFAYGLTDIAGALGAAIADDSVTTMTLAAAGEFPAENYLVLIGTELIWCGLRTATAVSACVRGVGGTTAAAHSNGAAITVYWTWGGVVKSVLRTKKGYRYGCLDFIDYLDGVVTKDYPSGATNTDVEILEDTLTFLHAPLNVQLDHIGITPTDMYAMALKNKTIRSVLDEFCLLTGNHYYAYQAWYDLNPQIRYFDPSGAASGITLAVGDIYADWSTDTDRTTIVNSLDAVATFPDIEPDPLVGYMWGQLSYYTGFDFILGKNAINRCGFKFFSPVDCTIDEIKFYVKRVGTFAAGELWAYLYDSTGNTTGGMIAATASIGTTFAYVSNGAMNLTVKAGVNYLELFASGGDDSNYYVIGTTSNPTAGPFAASDFDAFRTPIGIQQSLKSAGATRIWGVGTTELNASNPSALSMMCRSSAYTPGTWVDQGTAGMGSHPVSGWLFTALDAGSQNFYWPLLAHVSHVEYPYLEIELDRGHDNPNFAVLMYSDNLPSADMAYWSAYGIAKRGDKIIVPLDGSAGWVTGGGTPDWHDISAIGIWCTVAYGPFYWLKSMRLVGSTYTKSVSDSDSQHLYEVKYQSYPIPFQSKSQTDAYAAAQLARLKDPLTSITVRANRLLTPTPYNTVAVSPGSAMTPLVLGADMDPVRGQTKFIFDAYPQGGLVAILDSLNAGIS